jgi:hypothetical protein
MTRTMTRPSGGGGAAVATPPAPRRFSLANIRKNLSPGPDRIFLYGIEGVGKSSFAADAEAPVFLAAEDGVRNLSPVPDCVPEIRSFQDVLDALEMLRAEDHGYRTVVLDTLDWIDGLLRDEVCRRNGWSVEEFGDFGRGLKVTPDEWRRVINALRRLEEERGMAAVVIAHARTKNFRNPAGADYLRWEPNLGGDLGPALWKAWAHAVLFATYEHGVSVEARGKEPEALKRGKGWSTGNRILYTAWNAAWDAKNRYDLPERLPLSWEEYGRARDARRPASPEALVLEAEGLLGRVDAETAAAARPLIERHRGNAASMARVVDRLRARVVVQEEV